MSLAKNISNQYHSQRGGNLTAGFNVPHDVTMVFAEKSGGFIRSQYANASGGGVEFLYQDGSYFHFPGTLKHGDIGYKPNSAASNAYIETGAA